MKLKIRSVIYKVILCMGLTVMATSYVRYFKVPLWSIGLIMIVSLFCGMIAQEL